MSIRRAVPLPLCLLVSVLLTGCGSTPNTGHPTPVGNTQYSGSVHGGQQPVAGATIQLYTVGTTADGSAATPLLTSPVTSGPDGTFTITGLYSCTGATQVYIVATGGNPGLYTVNPNIALMTALGPCSSLTSSTFISINELTTVAAVSALAPFMTFPNAIGSSSVDATLLANAFTLANEYVNTTTGLSPGTNVPSGDTVPTAELNTLADILSACINSVGGTAGDRVSLCGQLFADAAGSSTPAPTNTIQAMLDIAYNPTLNTSALYALTPPTPPFQPTLTSAPSDFLVSLQSLSPIGVSPSAVNFQNVTVGSTSAIQTINIQNFSNLSPFITVGANRSDFIVGNFSSTYVGYCFYGGGGATSPCWIQVKAFPSATDVRNAFIEMDYNDGTSALYIPLSVTGVASNSSSALSSSLVNFPPTITATSSSAVPVTLSNSGSAPITVSAITINNNNFTQTNNCSSVAVNANCTIYITFAPTVSGNQSATLQVTNTGTGSNTVALNGTGVSLGTEASLWPSSLTYTIWGANEDLILTNSDTTPMSTTGMGAVVMDGSQADHAYSATNNCGSTLASGASCTLSVANIPLDPLSTYTAGFFNVTGVAYANGTSLSSSILTENFAYLTQNGSFSGPGTGTITFPAQPLGGSQTATVQLANIGSGSPAASLAIYGANPGDFTVSAVQPTVTSTPSSYCPAASTGTQPCTITVTFTPTVLGTRTAKISLDPPGSSTGQYLYVTGIASTFSVAPVTGFTARSELPSNIDPRSVGGVSLLITNIGTSTVSLAATLSGANSALFTVDTSQCQSIAPQATCYVNLTFLGTAVGSFPVTLLLSDKNSSASITTGLTGTTVYWDPLPNIFDVNFGTQAINTTSAARSFTVTDADGSTIGDPITLTLPANSNFSLPSGSSCPAGPQVCTLSIAFSPHVTGAISETLITTDAITGATSQTIFTGTGTP